MIVDAAIREHMRANMTRAEFAPTAWYPA